MVETIEARAFLAALDGDRDAMWEELAKLYPSEARELARATEVLMDAAFFRSEQEVEG